MNGRKFVAFFLMFVFTLLFLNQPPARAAVGLKFHFIRPQPNSGLLELSISRRHHPRHKHHRVSHRLAEYSFQYRLFYNRVDGFLFHFGIDVPERKTLGSGVALKLSLGYGTESKRLQYFWNFERGFFGRSLRFAPGFSVYDQTFSEDEWIISSSFENSLAAFLLHEDFMDFYRLQGYGGYVKQNLTPYLHFKVGYYDETHSSVRRGTDWALFGKHKKFRDNPPIQDADFRGFKGQLVLDTRDNRQTPERGWYVQLLGEYFPEAYKNALSYQRYILDFRRYQPISDGEILRFRLRLGDSRGDLPSQKWFDFGGISTLRGYRYKSFTGTQMALANFEYFINWDEMNRYPDVPLLDMFNLILFADAGTAWTGTDKQFKDLRPADFSADVGIALTNSDGRIRLNLAKRTDRSTNAMVVTFRLQQPF